MGRTNKQQMGPLCRLRRFQDTFQVNSPSFSVPISLGQSSSSLLWGHGGTSPETGSGKGSKSGNSRFFIPCYFCSQISAKSIHKTTIQDGESQVSTAVDIDQRLDCLHRPDRCLTTCYDSPSIQEVSSVNVRRSGLPVHGLSLRNVRRFSPNWWT